MKKIISLLLVLGILMGIVPLTGAFAAEGDSRAQAVQTMTMQYDDHLDVTGKTVEILTGSLTLDNNYLIATDVGEASVSIDGTIYNVTIEKAKLNLIMIMGQSNSGNHFQKATGDVTCPIGTAYLWGDGQGVSAEAPVRYTEPSMGFHAPLLAELYAQSQAAGDPVKNVLIWEEGITSKNGQSITQWAENVYDTSGTDDSVEMLTDCRAYYKSHSDQYEIVSSGIYWLQGESDTDMDPAKYEELFMLMWNRLKAAGMEYVAFFRVRTNATDENTRDDLFYTGSLSAQIKMINENPNFYLATTITENWIGPEATERKIDISNYITVKETYGKQGSYSDIHGNTATITGDTLTTSMKELFGSFNKCHYGKFGYGIMGADAAYNMYRAMHAPETAIELTAASGHVDRKIVLTNGMEIILKAHDTEENISFRPAPGSAAGTLKYVIYSGTTDITAKDGLVITYGPESGAIRSQKLWDYEDVSIKIKYTTTSGENHCVVCKVLPPYQWEEIHRHTYTSEVTAPTCTEQGYTTYTCTSCADSYISDIKSAKGHKLSYDSNRDGTHLATCTVCTDYHFTERCDLECGACKKCGYTCTNLMDLSVNISHSLNLASDISINYAVPIDSLNGYSGFYLECKIPTYIHNTHVGTESVILRPVLKEKHYYFTMTGILATQMNNVIESTLYAVKDGQIYQSKVDSYSIASYAYSQLNKENDMTELKVLCAQLLRYGAKAQIMKKYRTDSLADADMNAEHIALLTDLNTVKFGNNKNIINDLENPTVTWAGRSLSLDYKVTLRMIVNLANYKGNKEDLSVRVTYTNSEGQPIVETLTNILPYRKQSNLYAFDFASLLAAELRTVVTAVVYEKDVQVSPTMTYSPDTYGNGRDGDLLTLCQALIAYSDAALAYFTK